MSNLTHSEERTRTMVSTYSAKMAGWNDIVGDKHSPTVNFHFADIERTAATGGKLRPNEPQDDTYVIKVSSGPYKDTDAECVLFLSKSQVRALKAACWDALNDEG